MMTLKMDIEQHISQYKEQYWQFTDDGFSSILLESFSPNLDTKVIASTSVFPELVKLSDGSYHLIWDMKYWHFYDIYMRYAAFFLRGDLDEKKDAVSLCQYNIRNMIFEFLVCTMGEYPLVSYCIARDVLCGNPSYNEMHDDAICKRFTSKELTGKPMQSRMFVLTHEVYHHEFKNNQTLFNEDISTIKQILHHVYKDKIEVTFAFFTEEAKAILYDAIQSVLNDTSPVLLEEIVCSYRAFIQLYFMNKKDSDDTDGFILRDLIETIRITLQFHSSLSLVHEIWDSSIRAFESVTNGKNVEEIGDWHNKEKSLAMRKFFVRSEIVYLIIVFHSITALSYFM